MRRLRVPNIVGRGEEVATVRDAVGRASAGSGGCVFVVGEPGSGKTRLLDEACQVATSAGLRVLHAAAPAALTPPPFGVLGAAFRSYLRHTPPPADDELRPYTAGLRQVLPEWPGARETHQLSDDQLLALALEGSLRLVLALARDHGLLLAVDDLHAADSQTLAFVQHAVPALTAARVLLVGALRSGEPGPARNEVAALHRRGIATLLPLHPLDKSSVSMLAEALLRSPPPPRLSAYQADRSGGVPLFVEQLIEANLMVGALVAQDQELSWDPERAAAVPQSTAELVSDQVNRLPGSSLSLVQAIAIAGQADATLLASLCRLESDGLRTAVEPARAAGLIEDTPGGFTIRHPLIRDAVVEAMVEPQRGRLHRPTADAILARDPDEAQTLEVAAEHLQLAGDPGRAARLLVSAAERRLAQAAALAAETAARHALALASDAETREQASDSLARALTLVGRWEEALVCDSAVASEDPARLVRMARNAVRLARYDQAQALIEQARAAGGQAGLLATTSALLSIERGDADAALELGSEALSLAEADTGADVACEALYIVGRAHEIAGRAEQAVKAFARCAAMAAQAEAPSWRLQALMELGQIDFFLGEPPQRLREAFRLAREIGVFTTAVWAGITLVYALQTRGDLSEAVRVGEEIESLCREHRLDLLPHALLAAAAAQDSLVAGDGDDLITEALASSEDSNIFVLAESLRGWSALRAGKLEAAIGHLAGAAAAVRAAPASAVPADGPFLWVCALVAAGRMQEARAALQEVSGLPAAHRVHINAMLLALAAALVDGAPDAVQPALEPARKGAPYYRAVCLLLAAETLRPADAAAWAREALDVFLAAGADTDAARARRLLRELGAPVPRARRVGPELPEPLQERGVTAREGEVLRLIGNGLSNSEIAERLFLSVRTVEGNVSRLLAKLDLPNRAGLIAIAQSLFGRGEPRGEAMSHDTVNR